MYIYIYVIYIPVGVRVPDGLTGTGCGREPDPLNRPLHQGLTAPLYATGRLEAGQAAKYVPVVKMG